MLSSHSIIVEKFTESEHGDIAPAVRITPDLEELEDYEDYLDCYVTWKDRFYLESDEVPRIIASLGFRIPEVMDKNKFDKMVQLRWKLRNQPSTIIFPCDLVKIEDIQCPLMRALHLRESKNRNNRMSTIIFIRDFSKRGHEISGYIDFTDRLESETTDWVDYYLSKKKLLPKSSDLGYYNWYMNFANYNDSPHWKALVSVGKGVQFECKYDQKILNADTESGIGSQNMREEIVTPYYHQCFLLDHGIKKQK